MDKKQQAGAAQASPQEQKMFEALAKQALQMLLSEQAAEMILAGAKTKGPAEAIADAVTQVMQASIGAAQAAGLQITDDIVNAAAQPGVAMLVRALASAGYIDDEQRVAAEVMQMVDESINLDGAAPEAEQAPEQAPEQPVQEPVEF